MTLKIWMKMFQVTCDFDIDDIVVRAKIVDAVGLIRIVSPTTIDDELELVISRIQIQRQHPLVFVATGLHLN